MKQHDLAYFAGLFDGEGSIGIYHKTQRDRKHSYLTLQCIVQMTNSFIPHLLQMHFGGSLFVDKKFRYQNKAVSYRWGVVGRQALAFLQEIYPYLRIKQPEAKLAIEFQTAVPVNRGSRRLSEEEVAVRQAQALLLKNLKREGRKLPSPLAIQGIEVPV